MCVCMYIYILQLSKSSTHRVKKPTEAKSQQKPTEAGEKQKKLPFCLLLHEPFLCLVWRLMCSHLKPAGLALFA